MSALMDEATKLCKAEELKLTENIRQCKKILRSMKTRVEVSSDTEPPTSVNDNDILLKERQDIELLDQFLKKALKIRSSSAVSATSQELTCSSGSLRKASAVNDCNKRNPTKSSLSTDLKPSRQRAGQLKSTAGYGDGILAKTVPSSRPVSKGRQPGIKPLSTQKCTGFDFQIRPCRMTRHSVESDGGMTSVGLSSEVKKSCSQSEASDPKEQWGPATSLPLWQAQQAKKYRLWNKALARHSMPVPERDHFMKKLIGTFPTDWSAVHVAAMEAELDVLTQLGLDLTSCYNAELRRHQKGYPEPSTEKEYESLLMLTHLDKMMVQVIKEADRLKKDWERKMAGWHGALCPLRSRVEWHHSPQPYLPPLLAYSCQGELDDLHSLRLQVAELKLESRMHQAMCDALLDLISCESTSSRHLSATALRGVYSLLGEGGAQFPSLLLDTQLKPDGR